MTTIIKFFKYEHLPLHLQVISKLFYDLGMYLETFLPESAEKSAGMRKLLESKDCFVRAMLEKESQ